ncbi:hypothetical protein KA005_06015 [bacterium]|nr:hypothetical protein [bacterium]
MKKIIVLTLLTFIAISSFSTVMAHNPFITNPKEHKKIEQPPQKSSFYSTIVSWQHELRQKMSDLVRQSKEGGAVRPLLLLIGLSFLYGVIHSAGPGHGKALALSYILSERPSFLRAVVFGNLVALFHGISGIIFVLIIKLLLQKRATGSLEEVTHITQLISYSLLICLGLGILIKSIYSWIKSSRETQDIATEPEEKKFIKPLLSALAVGIIPCPSVVMVMLFALSMNLTGLGIVLGLAISMGMATTITAIVIIATLGKSISLSAASRHGNLAATLEHSIAIVAGLAVASLGSVFLWAAI